MHLSNERQLKSLFFGAFVVLEWVLATALSLLSVKSGNRNLGEMGLASAAKLFSIYQQAWV